MYAELSQLLEDEKYAIEESLFNQFIRMHESHYAKAGVRPLRERCERLVGQLQEAACRAPSRFAKYIRQVAEERISSGYHLKEIQSALTFFEQTIWRICAKEVEDRQKLLRCLTEASWVIGGAKDELALVYLEHAERTKASPTTLR